MTNDSFTNTKNNLGIIPIPFAGSESASKSTIGTTSGSGLINYIQGIPNVYATSILNQGKYLLRGDINAIGNLGTQNRFFEQCGGYHTYSADTANIIGGYPYKAILDWYDSTTGWIRKVRCIKTDGNCVTPIDDPTNGVNGSGTKY